MENQLPESKLHRAVVGGKTAANVSGKVLKYLAKKPFLNAEKQVTAKEDLEKDYAKEIFKGLVMLKGTALKIAQLLSFELDIIPASIRKELEKSYNQVPPINRALVRKAIYNSFHQNPESLFQSFDSSAFAAASLGQVHKAESKNGEKLAVKVQYPGIDKTIKNDLQMIRGLVKPTPYARFALPVLNEIEVRLLEEIDYLKEAENTSYFHQNLKHRDIRIPKVRNDLTSKTILSSSFLHGQSLDAWISTNPPQEARDHVGEMLQKQFTIGLFELRCLHADPNPGNFIIMDGMTIGIVDFGCVKRFTEEFVERYQGIAKIMIDGTKSDYLYYLKQLNVLRTELDAKTLDEIYKIFRRMGSWYGQLYTTDYFDFGKHSEFISQGKAIMNELYRYKKHFQPNPEFVFLNRTNYGLFRIFEKLKARVQIKNPYEWN